jgi:myo-inositol-1(or 4)-monophosphatase
LPKPGLIEAVIGIVQRAGTLIRHQQELGLVVEEKLHGAGPVTAADRAADRLLREELLRLAPGGWLSEEIADDQRRLREHRVWIVDPLDGTIEFVRGLPEYTVSVALAEAGTPVLGVIHNPATGDTVWATRGGGAFRNGRTIRVREGNRLLASRTELERGEFESFLRTWDIHAVGSTAWKLALVAAGEAAVTFSRGPKMEWDVCAGAVVVAEAGGRVSEAFGPDLRFNRAHPRLSSILAAAPEAWNRIRPELDRVGPAIRDPSHVTGR